ncbi:MAG: flagellar basal body-associated protein FliL [Candidimonas sp.]|nr:MAG: flagellar basal body-associated protein FliL [Candidimonas sp.]
MKLIRSLSLVVSALVALLIGIAGTAWGISHSDTLRSLLQLAAAKAPPTQAAKAEKGAEVRKPIFVELAPFTVTLQDKSDGASRVLYTSIMLRVASSSESKIFTEYMPEVRDRIITVLSSYSAADVTSPSAMETLKRRISDALAPPFDADATHERIQSVLFTAFIVQ